MTEAIHHISQSVLTDRLIIDHVKAEPWEYLDADTQHLTHNIHRYSGKFIPQIAARVISLLTLPGELVLDPYCGSGTTLVEAAILGRRALGVDLSPLAVLISRVKISPVPNSHLLSVRRELAHVLKNFQTNDQLPLFSRTSNASVFRAKVRRDSRLKDEWFQKWFRAPILEELIAIDHAIGGLKDARCQDIARVAFSNILRKSSNAHSGYPNVMFDKSAPERSSPVTPFLKSLDRVCEMVAALELSQARWGDVEVKRGNAVAMALGDCSVDAVVSHPPYIGSIPYAEYGALSLKWLGADPKQLDTELTGGRRQSRDVVERFEEGYGRMIEEVSRVLRPGRHMFLMVGNPVVKGETIDLVKMTCALAEQSGLKFVVQTERKGIDRRANKMGEEHLLFFKKPVNLGQGASLGKLHRVRKRSEVRSEQ